jgi:hypothetical protein
MSTALTVAARTYGALHLSDAAAAATYPAGGAKQVATLRATNTAMDPLDDLGVLVLTWEEPTAAGSWTGMGVGAAAMKSAL